VLPFFRKQQDHFAGESQFHGAGGEWHVDAPRLRWEILDAFAEAARESGIPSTEDFNRGDNEGCGYFHVTQKNGRRLSAAHAFLKPVRGRPNLHIICGSAADRVLFEDGRATGIRICRNGSEMTVAARKEVILCAGAV